ncbi:MAG: helix-turn-helix domain-containing protein [Clostridia bacterium]|nr:helix-turn-helix domain-containing protein [Clostridia bacterium]
MFVEINKELVTTLPFVLATVGSTSNQGQVLRPRGWEFHEFIWVTDGTGLFCVQDEQFVLQKGEGIFLRAGVPHSYQGKDLATAWCTFWMSDQTLDYLRVPDWIRYKTPKNQERENLQLQAFAMGDSTALTRSAAGYSYVIDFFSNILPTDDSVIAQVLRLLERRYAEPLTLTEIADTVHMDRYALCRAYKQARGVTVMTDLQRIRVAKAKRFLKYSTDPVEAVGRMCGFESPSYFGKRFREMEGCSPSEYRKLVL